MPGETTSKLASESTNYKSCKDILGEFHSHGEYFTPPSAVCNFCQCIDGTEENCVVVKCQKPSCKDYKETPGRCCDFTCISDGITDAKTLGIVVTLSIMLLFIVIAIFVVWLKMRRKKRFGTRLNTLPSRNEQQETNLDSIIKRNSIPNNLRSTGKEHSPGASHSPVLLTPSRTTGYASEALLPNSTTQLVPSSGSAIGFLLSKTTTKHMEHRGEENITSCQRTAESSKNLIQHEVVACCHRDKSCKHTTRRFEPPPPYSPPKKNIAFV